MVSEEKNVTYTVRYQISISIKVMIEIFAVAITVCDIVIF